MVPCWQGDPEEVELVEEDVDAPVDDPVAEEGETEDEVVVAPADVVTTALVTVTAVVVAPVATTDEAPLPAPS